MIQYNYYTLNAYTAAVGGRMDDECVTTYINTYATISAETKKPVAFSGSGRLHCCRRSSIYPPNVYVAIPSYPLLLVRRQRASHITSSPHDVHSVFPTRCPLSVTHTMSTQCSPHDVHSVFPTRCPLSEIDCERIEYCYVHLVKGSDLAASQSVTGECHCLPETAAAPMPA
ncbi:hypothetical protein J6590_055106 [Homalodisca vitripennis]|nr:hypothetical protein J6590_055106 [Homalodisca vitripennis]